MELSTVGLLVLALVLLVAGGELLVRGASRLAGVFGISPLVIGLTVVAFGTSSPELAVSLRAGLSGTPDLAVGNVVGSNVFNVLLILGVCALIHPLVVSLAVVRREVPVLIGVSVVLFLLARDGAIGPWEGLVLLVGIVTYIVWCILTGRRETAAARSDPGPVRPPVDGVRAESALRIAGAAGIVGLAGVGGSLGWFGAWVTGVVVAGGLALLAGVLLGRSGRTRWGTLSREGGWVVVGLGILVVGSDYLVGSAMAMARAFGVSDLIIGLTVVAAGTSLPEVATSVIATFRGERDIAVGNVVGSNIFNILGILGISALVTPGGLTVAPTVISFDLPVMVAVTVACLPVMFTGLSIARWEGALFLGTYGAYTAFLVLAATDSPALESLSNAILLVLPVVAATLLWSAVQALRTDPSRNKPRRGG